MNSEQELMAQNGSNKENLIQSIQIPDPVFYNTIQFLDQGIQVSYTDCWQISVLRFLHLIFGQKGQINQTKLTYFMDLNNQNCQKLIIYFKQNPTYHFQQSFYTTQEGFKIRAEWAQFLNKSGLFYLKKGGGKYQVAATIPNLVAFYRGYFPKLSNNQQLKDLTTQNLKSGELFESYKLVLQQIYNQFSIVSQIPLSLSLRTDKNLESDGFLIIDWLYLSSVQEIRVGKNECIQLEWQIYEYYNMFENQKIGSRQTGHSDYRYTKAYKEQLKQKKSENK